MAEATDAELLAGLGARLARERLRQDWSQAELAEASGVSRATIQRLEAGSSTQLTNLLRVLRALDLIENLDALVPEAPVRPLDELQRPRGARRRASSKRSDEQAGEASGWTWGEDA